MHNYVNISEITVMNLKNKSFLKLLDFTPEEILGLIDLSADLKAKKKAGIPHKTR